MSTIFFWDDNENHVVEGVEPYIDGVNETSRTCVAISAHTGQYTGRNVQHARPYICQYPASEGKIYFCFDAPNIVL